MTQRLVDQFNADECLCKKLEPKRRARRKLRPRPSRRGLKKLDLLGSQEVVFGKVIGIVRTRTPVAWNTAFAMAGAMTMMGVSPAPAEARSGRLSKWMSSSGTSRKRGTWYLPKEALSILRFSKRISPRT